jgi:flagellar basal body-associated protein FliL
MLIDTAVILNYLNARLDGINELIPSSEEEIKDAASNPENAAELMQYIHRKFEVEDLLLLILQLEKTSTIQNPTGLTQLIDKDKK